MAAASLRALRLRWAKHVRVIRRKRRRAVAQLRNLAKWWTKGAPSPNPAGRSLQPGTKKTEKGIAGLVQAASVFNQASREAKAEVESRRYEQPATEDVRAIQANGWQAQPKEISRYDWGGRRHLARHPEEVPEVDKYDWYARRQEARRRIDGHHGAGHRATMRGPRWHRPPR